MSDPSKIDQELFKENTALKQKIRELEQAAAGLRQEVEKLREGKEWFQAIADSSPDLEHWLGPDGKFLWISPNVFDFTGYTVEECLNMADYPLVLIAEPDREIISQLFMDAMLGPSDGSIECPFTRKDGRKKWVSIAWRPIYDKNNHNLGHRASLHDITSRKLMEDQLRDSKERLEAMISALPDLMFRVDKDGFIHECYTSDINLLYFPLSSFPGKKITEALPEEAAQIIMAALDKAAARGSHHGVTYSLPTPKGLSWYELSIAAMGDKKQPVKQFIILVRNITKHKRLDEELKKAHDELEVRVQERTAELAQVVLNLTENEQMLADESHRLHETNTALKVLLRYREEDQQDIEEKILLNVKKLVLALCGKAEFNPADACPKILCDRYNRQSP